MSIYQADNDDLEDFFAFRELKPRKSTCSTSSIRTNVSVPKVKKQIITTPRNHTGTDYVKKYEKNIEEDIAKTFGGLNLTGISSGMTFGMSFDDSALFDTHSVIQPLDDTLQSTDFRKDLPIFQYRDDIIRNIRGHPIIMISGPTGCGKSTQVPQYIYDDFSKYQKTANILISQPRKIAAITLAQRVAQERDVPVGTLVGYQVGLNKCINLTEESTQMTFCTTGVILQKLLKQKSLARYTHIILDEVHERDLEIDFLITVIRRLLTTSSSTKIILMSATLDVEKFQNYWKIKTHELDHEFFYPPVIDLDARARKYEIVERYLDDIRKIEISPEIINPRDPGITNEMYGFAVKLILLILRAINTVKPNILIFLPGLPEIERLQQEFEVNDNMTKLRKFDPDFHILHSSLSMEEQKLVFVNNGKRKIILATNIAESSITIPNISYVIDFCLTKHLKNYKGSQMSSYIMAWASKNNCKQRAGRTGRVSRGTVFRLVFKDFYYRNLPEHSIPEIQLAPLESIIVKIKDFNMGAPLEILAGSLDPPDESSIVNAILTLKEHGALLIHDKGGHFDYHDGELTYLGEIMAALPCDIRITKLIVLGYLFSVLDEAIIIAAGLNFKGVFINSLTDRMGTYCCKMKWSNGTGSDCIATFKAYSYWYEYYRHKYFKTPDDERFWCRQHGLDVKILHEMRLWINEIKKRLIYYKIDNLPYPNQPFWSKKEKMLVLKVVMAGAFGIANFFVTDTQIDTERDAFQMFDNLDVFRTVYCRNMDRTIVGDVYKKQLRETLVEKGVCTDGSKVAITFDRGSERVYITFDDSNENQGFSSGNVVPEVFKAVKLSKLECKIELFVLTAHETVTYAIDQGFGTFEQSEFQMQYPYIEYPEFWPLPTRTTRKMRGYVTHIEHCNKFYFCPLIGYNMRDDLPDHRYESAVKNIKLFLKSFTMNKVKPEDTEKIKVGQMLVYKNIETNENERAQLLRHVDDKIMEIHLMDRGINIEAPIKYISTITHDIEAKKLKMYPKRVFECKLKEIEPSCMGFYGNKWSSDAVEYFRGGVLYQNAVIEIYSVVANIVTVELQTFEGEVGTHWNHNLIAAGYAQEAEESYASKLNHSRRIHDIYALDKPIDPKAEFATVVDQHYVKTHEMEGPDKKKCDRIINLIGPYSPLETNLRAVATDITGYVRIDSSSINHILLNDEILSLHDKFYVAADVNIGTKNGNVKIRETTAMPNIPGLAVLLSMIFSPIAQLRRDKEKTRYISLKTGLGLDDNYGKPYFFERDATQCIDIHLQEEDISDINRLRFHMSSMLHRDPFHQYPDLNDRQREQILKNIKEAFSAIINKKHPIRDSQIGVDHFSWNIDQADSIRHTSKLGHGAIWDYISIPPLNEMPNDMKIQLIKHAKQLESPQFVQIQECKLCGKPLDNPNELKFHLMSKIHVLRKQQLGLM